MRRHPGAFTLILASVLISGAALPVAAQSGGATSSPIVPPAPNPGRNVAPTGRVMPPSGSRASDAAAKSASSPTSASINSDMLKAQKASEARNKNWDSRMRKTMGSICSGC